MILLKKNKKLVQAPDDLQLICMATNILTPCEDIIFVDGTLFEYAPKYFLRHTFIHGRKNGYYLLLVFILFFN